VVDLCPRASSLRRRLLQRRRGAWEGVQEQMQIVVCTDDIWKTGRVLGSWFVDGRYAFLLRRLSHVGVPDLEFDGMSGVLSRSDSSTVMASSLASHLEGPQSCILAMEPRRARGEKVIRYFFFRWLLWWCRKQVTDVGVKRRDVLLSFQFCHVGLYVTCTLIFMI